MADKDGFYDSNEEQLLWSLTLIFGIISIIAQFMIFCTYICLKLESPISARVEKDKARSIHVFIACISFYDLIRIMGTLMNAEYPYSSNIDKCITESIFIVFGAMSTFILIGIISIIMIISVLIQSKAVVIVDGIHAMRAIILIIISILALLGALIPLNYWCSDEYHASLRGIYLIPLLIVYGIVITSYILIAAYFCYNKSMKVNNNFYRDIKLFPAILVLCWAFSVYRRIYNVLKEKEPPFVISCIAVITVSIYGFCNFIAYWLTMNYQYKKKKDANISSSNVNQNEMQAISQHDDDSD